MVPDSDIRAAGRGLYPREKGRVVISASPDAAGRSLCQNIKPTRRYQTRKATGRIVSRYMTSASDKTPKATGRDLKPYIKPKQRYQTLETAD